MVVVEAVDKTKLDHQADLEVVAEWAPDLEADLVNLGLEILADQEELVGHTLAVAAVKMVQVVADQKLVEQHYLLQ
jgi:hypothetical protein